MPLSRASRLRFAFALTGSLLAVACGESLTAEQLLERGRASLEEGKLRAATVDTKAALQQSPTSAEGRSLLGDIAMARVQYAEAAAEYERALSFQNDPAILMQYAKSLVEAGSARKLLDEALDGRFVGLESNAVVLASLASAEAVVGNRSRATELINQALENTADDPYVRLIQIRHVLSVNGDMQKARELADLLVADYPEYASAFSVSAMIASVEGDVDAAIASYSKAAELNHRRLRDRLGLVGALISAQEFERAQAETEALDERIPESPLLNYYQGRLALAQGRIEDGLAELREVLSDIPNHPGALYFAGLANLERGNLATAERQLNSFVADQPRHLEGRLALGRLYLSDQNASRAADVANSILRDYPGEIRALKVLATARTLEGDFLASADLYAQIKGIEDNPAAETQLQLGASLVKAGDVAGVAELERARDMNPADDRARRLLIASYLAQSDGDKAKAEVASFREAMPDSAIPYVLEASVALWAGSPDEAALALEEALKIDPQNAEALRGKAGLALQAGDTDAAISVYQEALAAQPDELTSLIALAQIYERAGDREQMAAMLERAVAADAEALPPRLALARYWMTQNRAADSVRLLTEVRETHDDSPQLNELLAGAFLVLGETGSAVGAAEKLLELTPDDARALRVLAVMEQADKAYASAERHIKRSLELAPDMAQSRRTLVELFIDQEKYDSLADYLAEFPDELQDEPDVKLARGRVELLRKDVASAIPFLEAAHAEMPSRESVFLLVSAYFSAQRFDDGEALAKAWLENAPNDQELLQTYATYLLANGRDDEGATYFARLFEMQRDNVVVLNNLAWAYRSSNPQKALELVDAALEAAPDNMSMLDTRSVVLRNLGRFDDALEANELAMRLAPGFPQLLFHRAEILAEMDRSIEAIATLEKLESVRFAEQAAAMVLLETLRGG